MDALFIPAEISTGETYQLVEKVCAIQILPTGDGARAQLGRITELPLGAEVNICGTGFNERTVKVSYNGSFYFAFSDNFFADDETAALLPKQCAAGFGTGK